MSSNMSDPDIIIIDKAQRIWAKFNIWLAAQVTPEGEAPENYNPLFEYFMADKEDFVEAHKEEQDNLVQALEHAEWEAALFQEENIAQIALSCFRNDLITYQQLITILDRQQQRRDFGEIATDALLDNDGNYTGYALVKFLPLLVKNLYKKQGIDLNQAKIEALRHLLKALPKSEQIVYSSRVSEGAFYESGIPPGGNAEGSFASSLLGKMDELGVMIFAFESKNDEEDELDDGKQPLISMSSGVADAVSIIVYGLERYVNPVYRRGPIDVRAIEWGVRRSFRPSILVVERDIPPKEIHEHKNPGLVSITAHDRYHSGIMSRMTEAHRMALTYMIDVAREGFKSLHEKENKPDSLMTREMWIAIDAAFPIKKGIAFFEPVSDIKKSTEEFCRNLAEISRSHSKELHDNYSGFLDAKDNVSVFGMLVFIDMLQYKDKWNGLFNIDPEFLIPPFQEGYKLIQKISDCDKGFLQNSPELQALKLSITQEMGAIQDQALSILLQEIEQFYKENEGNKICEFRRNRKQDSKLLDENLLPNQIGLHIFPQHQEFFEGIKQRFKVPDSNEIAQQRSYYCTAL